MNHSQRSETILRTIYGIVMILALAAITMVLVDLMKYNFINSDETLWSNGITRSGDTVLVVAQLLEGGAADRAGVRVGDRVIAINGKRIGASSRAAQSALDESPTDRDISYVVERKGVILDLRIRLVRPFTEQQFAVPTFALLWLVIGAIVVFSKPRGDVQRSFFLTGATVIFAFSFPSSQLNIANPPFWIIALRILWATLHVLFYPLWVRFCSIFPIDQKIFITNKRRLLLYAFPILYGLMMLALIGASFVSDSSAVQRDLYTLLTYSAGIASIIYYAAGVLLLYRGYRRMPAAADARPMRVILVGSVLAGLALIYFTLILQATGLGSSTILHPELLLPIVLLVALPVAFGYAIFKYQVMDFRRVVRTTLVYTLTMALIAGFYLALAYGLGQAFGSLTGEKLEGPIGVASFILFVLLFEQVKRRVQTAIENRFFPQRRDYSAMLARYVAEVSETVGSTAVANLMARTLRQSLKLNGVVVVLEEPNGDNLTVAARDCDFAPVYLPEEAIAELRLMLRSNHTLIALETISEPAVVPLQEHFSYTIGMYAQGRVIGALLLTRPNDGESLSGNQTPFIAGVAGNGASAIEVARLYEAELERQRIREELSMARRIQQGLLPSKMPVIPGISISALSRPAQAVGGDYYDVMQLADDRFLVIVADVSGKGLAASLYMAEFHGMAHVVAGIPGTPKQMLTRLNEHLFDVIARGSFISATMLLFDTTRRTITCARAGHTPILRYKCPQVEELIPSGVALGLCSRNLFSELLQEQTVDYEPGERFILYSDGVSEAMNEQREEFGDARLHNIIANVVDNGVDDLRDTIVSHVDSFRGTAEQNDDITLVVINVQSADEPHVLPEFPIEQSTTNESM